MLQDAQCLFACDHSHVSRAFLPSTWKRMVCNALRLPNMDSINCLFALLTVELIALHNSLPAISQDKYRKVCGIASNYSHRHG